jgi:hypothetical protein
MADSVFESIGDAIVDFSGSLIEGLPQSIARRIFFRAIKRWIESTKKTGGAARMIASILAICFYFGSITIVLLGLPHIGFWLNATASEWLYQMSASLLNGPHSGLVGFLFSFAASLILLVASLAVGLLGIVISIPGVLLGWLLGLA